MFQLCYLGTHTPVHTAKLKQLLIQTAELSSWAECFWHFSGARWTLLCDSIYSWCNTPLGEYPFTIQIRSWALLYISQVRKVRKTLFFLMENPLKTRVQLVTNTPTSGCKYTQRSHAFLLLFTHYIQDLFWWLIPQDVMMLWDQPEINSQQSFLPNVIFSRIFFFFCVVAIIAMALLLLLLYQQYKAQQETPEIYYPEHDAQFLSGHSK